MYCYTKLSIKSHLLLGTCIFHLISTTGFNIYRKWNRIWQTRQSKCQSKKLRQIGSKQKNQKTNINPWSESGRKVQLMFRGSFILRWMSESGGHTGHWTPIVHFAFHLEWFLTTSRGEYSLHYIWFSSLSTSAECGFILNSNHVSLYHILLQSVKTIATDTFVHFGKNYTTEIEWVSY